MSIPTLEQNLKLIIVTWSKQDFPNNYNKTKILCAKSKCFYYNVVKQSQAKTKWFDNPPPRFINPVALELFNS